MLVGLHVKNLALIEQADVEFGNGLNILTGETGAGKSIIIGSVALALGAKASRDMIRCGEEYAYIELIFSVDDEKKREELKKMDVYPDEDGLLIISKKITQTRSISRINDETVTTARLKAVTGKLLDIHGQHEHQSLLHKQKHLEILDEYSWRETGSLKRNVAESYRRYLELKGKLDGFSLDEESRKRELDFVRFEIDEIEDSALKPGEEEELAAKFRKFSHSQKIMERLQGAYQAVDGDAIGRAYREMESVASYDERLSGIAAGLSDAESILSDICRSISDYMDEMEFSGEDFKKDGRTSGSCPWNYGKIRKQRGSCLKESGRKEKNGLRNWKTMRNWRLPQKPGLRSRSGFWDFSADGSRRREKKQQRFWRTGSRRSLRI
ncbi:MAG: AAA family ATPase [Clostridiaceae bacterium]